MFDRQHISTTPPTAKANRRIHPDTDDTCVAIYDGRQLIGAVEHHGDRYDAFDRDGDLIDSFSTYGNAVTAICRAARHVRLISKEVEPEV